jgi:pimeloyl-ACP methyl ester carboxylesterase
VTTATRTPLYNELAGAGAPLVLVHAGICDSRMWDPQWVSFASGHRAARCDLRGFGRSPLAPGRFSHPGDLIELLDELALGPATLVGASLGGGVALQVAVARPELVSALVLVGSGVRGHDWSEDVERAWAAEEDAFERGDLDAAVDVSLRIWVDGPRRAPDQVDPEVRAKVAEMIRRTYELARAEPAAEEEALVDDVGARLGEIRAPALVITGDLDVPDVQALAERFERELPHARRATIAGAAHLPSMERPTEFERLVLDFLAEVEG